VVALFPGDGPHGVGVRVVGVLADAGRSVAHGLLHRDDFVLADPAAHAAGGDVDPLVLFLVHGDDGVVDDAVLDLDAVDAVVDADAALLGHDALADPRVLGPRRR